jgi:hypothetical protein
MPGTYQAQPDMAQGSVSPPPAPPASPALSGSVPATPPEGTQPPQGQGPPVENIPAAGTPPVPGSPPPGYTPYRAPQPTDGMAVAALVLGIGSFFMCPLVGAVLAVIFGYMARQNIRNSGGTLGGEGFATAGIILGFIHLGLLLLVVIIVVIVVFAVGTSTNSGLVVPALLTAFTFL